MWLWVWAILLLFAKLRGVIVLVLHYETIQIGPELLIRFLVLILIAKTIKVNTYNEKNVHSSSIKLSIICLHWRLFFALNRNKDTQCCYQTGKVMKNVFLNQSVSTTIIGFISRIKYPVQKTYHAVKIF